MGDGFDHPMDSNFKQHTHVIATRWLLAMTWNSKYSSAIPRRATPELLREFFARQRARGMPGARCTRSLVCIVLVAHECSHHGRTGTPGIPAREWF
jgi:hypothetical protein